MDKFKNTHRIPSSRLQSWDYGAPGLYFISICTKNREQYFGKIENCEMFLNELGLIVNKEWIKTPLIRRDMNLELGEFITMPNHFHAIIMIGENKYNSQLPRGGVICGNAVGRDAMHGVSTTTTTDAVPTTNQKIPNKFGPQSKNLASIVRGFKSSVTTQSKKINIEFGWQARFHDHIIRSHDELFRISSYIINNPDNWKEDKFFN
ncbi:MAG TPA: hypothetical protein VGP55_05620 [Chitinophagaceae bacterium]|nr:hypothetical protein [Chitinophagaceae bacterium]